MARRSRTEQRILKEQETVGMRRDERKEQEELAGKKKYEAARTKAMQALEEKKIQETTRPARIARVGKPLKRAR